MSLSISPFKAWIAALVVLIGMESVIYLRKHPDPFDRTNFLQFSFERDETPQRLFMFHKVKSFAQSNPILVQSGDSSGFYGIDPRVITNYLPKGMTYVNMSCCANLGYRGYYNVFQFMGERNTSVRYFVLHVTPYTMPRSETWDSDGAALWGTPDVKVFGQDFYHEFMSPWRVFHLPSMSYRRAITDFFYYAGGKFNQPDRPLLNNVNYFSFLKIYRESGGWMPESDNRIKVPATECDIPTPDFFDFTTLSRKTYLQEILEANAALAKKYNATLIVVFQPVACTVGTGKQNALAREVIENFKRDHPEVEIPFPLIETWPSELFSVPAHIVHEHTDLIGVRLGKALAEIVKRHEAR